MRKMLNEWRKFLEEGSEVPRSALNPGGDTISKRPSGGPSSYSDMGDSEPLWIQALSYVTEVLDEESTSIDFTSLVTKVAEKMLMGPNDLGSDRTEDIKTALSSDAAINALKKKGWIGNF